MRSCVHVHVRVRVRVRVRMRLDVCVCVCACMWVYVCRSEGDLLLFFFRVLYACRYGHLDTVEVLLNAGVSRQGLVCVV